MSSLLASSSEEQPKEDSDLEKTMIPESLVHDAFVDNAIQSVVLIDEQFPTLSDTLAFSKVDEDNSAMASRFVEWEKGRDLYSAFQAQQLVCDVVNDPTLLTGSLQKAVTETDLVILDLHLSKGSEDVSDSVEIIQGLADSPKFNLVVLYTKATELGTAARCIGGSLRGAPKFEDDKVTLALSEINLEDHDVPLDDLIDGFLQSKTPVGPKIGPFRGVLGKDHKLNGTQQVELINQVAITALSKRPFGSITDGNERTITGLNFNCDNPWMVLPNLFIVLANKKSTEPPNVLDVLKGAIVDWNPGPVRTIVSQIQNIISKRGYGFEDCISDDRETQIAWLWHAVQSENEQSEAVSMLLNRLMLSLKSDLSGNTNLQRFASNCLKDIPNVEPAETQFKQLLAYCGEGQVDIDAVDALHALNCYESSTPFGSRDFITTGTVLFAKAMPTADDDEAKADDDGAKAESAWWVCVEPACDTVPRVDATDSFLQCRLLKLQPVNSRRQKVVESAELGRYLFVNRSGRQYLDALDCNGNPVLETAFVKLRDQIIDKDGLKTVEIFFPMKGAKRLQLKSTEVEVVAQLNEPYANRLLHQSGHHMSRIGLNFVNLPENEGDASKCNTN